jgi:DNA-binding transcriptional LysR family regulator
VAVNLVRGGLGVAFLPASVVASYGAGLAVIEISDHAFRWVVSVAVPSDRRIPATARALLAELPGAQPSVAQRQEPSPRSPAA